MAKQRTLLAGVANLLGLGAAWKVQRVRLVALAMQVCRKVRIAKGGLFKAERRFLSFTVACLTEVRWFVAFATDWLRSKDMYATNQLDQVVIVHGIKTLLKFQIFLLELSFLCFDRRDLLLKRIERLADFIDLTHER